VGTVLYALAIGPLVQRFLPWWVVSLEPRPGRDDGYRSWLEEYRPACRDTAVRSW
jgi:hypothetical protein